MTSAGHDSAEDRYTRAMLDVIGDRLDAEQSSLAAGVDQYLANLREGVAQSVAEAESRIAAGRDATARWLNSIYDDGPDDGAALSVSQRQPGASSPESHAPASSGAGAGSPNPRGAELAEAEEADRIRRLSLQDYAQERQRLIRAGQPVMF